MTVLVGKNAPDFTSAAVLGSGEIVEKLHFKQFTQGSYALVFFYPLDFTFVCPSELIALNRAMSAFDEIGVKVLGISVDSQFTHNAWRNTPVEQGGIGPVQYTLVADVSHSICKSYGIEHPEAQIALRAAFLVDKSGIVRSQLVNDLPVGRNIEEILRLFKALQFVETHGEVCPANWESGKQGMRATPEGVAEYLTEFGESL